MKNLSCPRCQQLYSANFNEDGGQIRHPMLLRCGHTFCLVCVKKIHGQETLICPTCQMSTKVPNGQLYKSVNPDMFTVGRMWNRRLNLEMQSQKISEKFSAKAKRRGPKKAAEDHDDGSGISCSECLVNTAVCQCFKCESVMCKPCYDKIHQRSHTLQKHRPVGLTSTAVADSQGSLRLIMPKKAKHRNCPVHDQCQIEYYCDDDQQAICSRCVIMGDHKGHSVQTMEDKNKVLLAEMEPAVLEAQETIWRLEKAEKMVRESMPLAKVNTDLMDTVSQHFMTLHALLQAREEQMLDTIKAASNTGTSSFQEMRTHLEQEKLQLELALMDAARARHGSLHSLVDADLILERLKKAKDLPCMITIQEEAAAAPIKFSFEDSMKDAIQQYGDVSVADSLQMISLTPASPDAEKPPAEELRSYSVADLDLDSLSTTDSTSVSLCGSVVVEDNKMDSDSAEEQPAAAEVVEAETISLPPMKRLVVGNRERVNVTHISTPALFFIQLVSQQTEMEDMHKKINYHCRSLRRAKNVSEPVEIGSLVLAQYAEDKGWYRGLVTRVIQSDKKKKEDKFEIRFVDYGNKAVLPLQKLRKMMKRFTAKPVFAHECGLFDILPADEKAGWTAKSVQNMLEMTQDGTMHMVVVNVVGGRLEVDLGTLEGHGVGPDGPVSVRDSLVFLELAVFNARSAQGSVPAFHKREYLTEARVPEGTVANIGINCALSPSLFYAQFTARPVTDTGCSSFQIYNEEYHGHLHRLLMSMQQVYSQQTKHLYKVFCPRMGMICVARYAKDNNWYRAEVTGLPGHGRVEVQFVDYGNKEVVDHSDICKILDDHIKFPMQALEVTLADVEPVEQGQWSEEAKDWFRSVSELQLCQFRVTMRGEKTNSLVGVLYAINSQTNRLCCINYELVKRGFAKSTGQWSVDESFTGITLVPELINSPSSPRSASPISGVYRVGSPVPLQSPSLMEEAEHSATFTRIPDQHAAEDNDVGEQEKTRGGACPPKAMVEEEELGVGESRKLDEHALEVVVCSYHSPSHFYIQQQEKQSDLHRLIAEMKCYEKMPSCDREWTVGEFCAAKSGHDNRWHRGCIHSIQVQDNVYQVKLVDFGHVDNIPVSDVKPLKSAHGKMECFVERCHMADLMPTGTTDRTQWSQTAKEFMSKTLGLNPTCYVTLKGDRVSDMGLPVDVLVEESTPPTALEPVTYKYISLSAKLQDRGLAIPLRKEKTPPSSPDSKAALRVKMFSTKPTPTYTGAESSDEEEERKTASSEEGPGVTNALTIIQPNLEVAPHPPPSSTQLHVAPVHVDVEGLIYAQDVAEASDCQAMIDLLQGYAQQEAPEGMLQVKEGQICVAFCPTYSLWLRAAILKVDSKGVEVKYIDYGNTDQVPKTNLKLITPELCAQHQLVYEMRLQDVNLTSENGSWPEEYKKFLNSHVINKPFTALIQGSIEEHPLRVDLIDDQNGDNVLNAMRSTERDLDLFYIRSNDIANVLKLSNPYTPLKLGNKGDVVHAAVTHMELPNLVFLQRCDDPADGQFPGDLVEVDQLLQELNNLPPQTPGFKEVPSTGTMCIGCFWKDNGWYRALVVKAWPKDQTVLVLFVDYGNSDILSLDRLRVLPPRFQTAEMQSVRAYLNLTLPESQDRWTLDTYRTMVESILEIKHRVLIKETVPLTVELYDREEGVCLSYDSLIQKGLVVIPQPDENPSIEVTGEESSSNDEGSTTSISPELESAEVDPAPLL